MAGRSAVTLSEQSAKITDIIEPALLTDGSEILCGTGQKIGSHRKTVAVEIFDRCLGNGSLKTAETLPFVRVGGAGDHLYCNRFRMMLMDKIQHLFHAVFSGMRQPLKRRRAFEQGKLMEQRAPDPADQFKSVKFIVCTLRVEVIKCMKKFKERLMSFLIMVKEKTKDRRMKNRKHGFLINVSKFKGR